MRCSCALDYRNWHPDPADGLYGAGQSSGASTVSNPQAEALQDLMVAGFAELGLSAPDRLHRTFLLRNMAYAGQRFCCGGWQAVWLLGGDSVDFYDEEGSLVKTLPLTGEENGRAT